jgi:hypothetical protein
MTPYAPQPSLIRAVRGPILLIAIGVLFALDHFTQYHIRQTWPVLLILLGILSLAGRLTGESRSVVPAGPPPPPSQTGGLG